MAHRIPQNLTIAGDGPLLEELKAASSDFPNIRWCGRVPADDVYRLISESEVLLLPTECYETFGRTVVEAYSVSTPVISSRGTAPGDLVVEGVTGQLVDPGDSDGLAKTVSAFFALDDNARSAMRENAKREFEESYGRASNLSLLEDIYAEAVEN